MVELDFIILLFHIIAIIQKLLIEKTNLNRGEKF